MRFVLHDHQGKGAHLAQLLISTGMWIQVGGGQADLLLIDHDVPGWHREIIKAHKFTGGKVVMYPHGAMPIVSWDGMFPPSELVDLTLTPAWGQAEVLRRYGYPGAVEVLGWSLCEVLPFEPVKKIRTVLFAPVHPTGGQLHPAMMAENRAAFEQLLGLDVTLIVRHVDRDVKRSGLVRVDRPQVIYQASDMSLEGALAAIRLADVVVARGTLAYLAVALGKPVVFFGQNVRPWDRIGDQYVYAQHWEAYRELVHFPFDLADGEAGAVLQESAASGAAVAGWKERFIGEPVNGFVFAEGMHRLVQEAAGVMA